MDPRFSQSPSSPVNSEVKDNPLDDTFVTPSVHELKQAIQADTGPTIPVKQAWFDLLKAGVDTLTSTKVNSHQFFQNTSYFFRHKGIRVQHHERVGLKDATIGLSKKEAKRIRHNKGGEKFRARQAKIKEIVRAISSALDESKGPSSTLAPTMPAHTAPVHPLPVDAAPPDAVSVNAVLPTQSWLTQHHQTQYYRTQYWLM